MTSLREMRLPKSVVLVGLMGAGKSCIGKRLAIRLGVPFVDADTEIEKAAGCSIPDIFELYGESAFRDGERRVIDRLLREPTQILATGGGALMDPETRRRVAESAISVWLRADLDLLVSRTSRRGNRPLLKSSDRRETLRRLMEQRHPVYEQTDITVDSGRETPDLTVNAVIQAIRAFLPEDPALDQPAAASS